MAHLVNWRRAVRSAEVDADRFLRSAKLVARDVLNDTGEGRSAEALLTVAQGIAKVRDVDEVPKIAELLLTAPLPLPVFAETPTVTSRPPAADKKPPRIIVAFTSFLLDGLKFDEPHTVQPGLVHDLTVEIAISGWPQEAQELLLEPVSVEPLASYELPIFSIGRPEGTPPYSVSKTGRMVLHLPQSFFARPLEFTYRARFLPDSGECPVFVQGQRNLMAQGFDPSRDPLSGYEVVDRRIMQIRDQSRRAPAVSDRELGDFLVLLAAVGRIAGQSLQDNLFPGQYLEGEFQARVKSLLRSDRLIGAALEEHPHAGGGITDLSFRGIRLELKAISDRLITMEDAQAFLPQTAQYVVGSDRRFGILSLLDCSPKTAAPGSAADDIDLRVVPPPTGGNLPILIGVVILRGNLAKPSALS